MKDRSYFRQLLIGYRDNPSVDYGGNVMPALELFACLKNSDERLEFQAALELMLRDDSKEIREFAINVCLGFFVFKDAISK